MVVRAGEMVSRPFLRCASKGVAVGILDKALRCAGKRVTVVILSTLFPRAWLLMRAIILAHDDLPDHLVGQLHFPSRHRRFPGHALD
jgi:hypothetical protein